MLMARPSACTWPGFPGSKKRTGRKWSEVGMDTQLLPPRSDSAPHLVTPGLFTRSSPYVAAPKKLRTFSANSIPFSVLLPRFGTTVCSAHPTDRRASRSTRRRRGPRAKWTPKQLQVATESKNLRREGQSTYARIQ